MRKQFDLDLVSLNEAVINMGELCEEAIAKATDALKAENGNVAKAKEVIDVDADIGECEKQIEHICMKLLLQQQPVARDLRQISSTLKMITDLKRIGTQAADISEIIISAQFDNSIAFPKLYEMAEEASKMVSDSVHAYLNKDLELAGRVESNDDIVDRMFEDIKNILIDEIRDNQDSDIAKAAIDLIIIAKYLERIADHAENVAKWAVFAMTGVHDYDK